MRRIFFLFILLLLLKLPIMAQTMVWEEGFGGPPTDWTIEGNWAFDNGSMLFYYYPVVENFDFSAISPEIQIPAFASELSVNQFIDPYLSGVTNETCEIWVVKGDEQTMIFSYEIINGTWGDMGGGLLTQSLNQFAGQSVQLRFRTWGASTNSLWNWTIFNASITTSFENDLCAIEVNGPSNVLPGVGGTWNALIENAGQLPQSDFLVRLFSYKTGEQVGEETFTGTINAGEFGEVNFEWVPQDYQNTSLYCVIDEVNDEFAANNRSKGFFVRIEPPVEHHVLLWDNDNDIATIYNDETGQKEQANVGIENALYLAGISYIKVNSLPDDLSDFNLVICTMGSYCLS